MTMQLFPTLTRSDYLLIALIFIFYFVITLPNLTGLPIFVDEAIYGRWSQISLYDASWRFISLTDGKQPLFMWIAMPFLKIINNPLFAIRLVSVLSGLGTIIAMWYAGFLTGGKRTAYWAAFFGTITPFLFFYNRFAVVGSMLTFFGVLIFCLSLIYHTKPRLDLALIIGITIGLAMLVKSPAVIYLYLFPAGLITNHTSLQKRSSLLQYLGQYLLIFVLAQMIYNIQRLSPWMHIIIQKNNDFAVPIAEILQDPIRLGKNIVNSTRWLLHYLTWPVAFTGLFGAYQLGKKNLKQTLHLSVWFLVPLAAEIAIASLYRSRYILFVVPYFLLFVAYFVSRLELKRSFLISLGLSIMPMFFIILAITSPLETPLLSDDADYTDGWASGNGVKEISQYLTDEARSAGGQQIIVGTEGTFGLLPHGLELYTYGLNNLTITGYWPLNEIPPQDLRARESDENTIYFVLNNTQIDSTPPGLEEILAYKKHDDSWIRLYRLIP